MVSREHAEEILQALRVLPPDKVAEVHDFVLFLRQRYGKAPDVDESTVWTQEDLHDVTAAVWQEAEQAVPWQETTDG